VQTEWSVLCQQDESLVVMMKAAEVVESKATVDKKGGTSTNPNLRHDYIHRGFRFTLSGFVYLPVYILSIAFLILLKNLEVVVVIAIIGAGIAAIVTVFLGGGKKRKKVLVLVALVRVLVPLVLFHYYTRIVSRLIEKDYLGL
jgi:hypothetical protein